MTTATVVCGENNERGEACRASPRCGIEHIGYSTGRVLEKNQQQAGKMEGVRATGRRETKSSNAGVTRGFGNNRATGQPAARTGTDNGRPQRRQTSRRRHATQTRRRVMPPPALPTVTGTRRQRLSPRHVRPPARTPRRPPHAAPSPRESFIE